MRTSDIWSRILGWQKGDYLKYYFVKSGEMKGIWIYCQIEDLFHEFAQVKIMDSRGRKAIGFEVFMLRLYYVQRFFPHRLERYTPRKRK